MEQYLQILLDAMGNTTLWAFTTQASFFASLGFGVGDALLVTLAATIGGCLGAFINYGIGVLCSRLQTSGASKLSGEKYLKWQSRFTWMMLFIGIFSWIHLMGVLVAVAGFLRVPAKIALPSLVLGQILYYGYHYSQYAPVGA